MWAKEAAVGVTVRLQSYRYTQPDDWHRQLAHGVVSPPEETVNSVESFRREWRRSYQLAHDKGFRGTVSIPHPWRLNEEGKERYREEQDDEPEVGAWVWIRNECPEEWRELTKWSPHFHIVGFTTPDMDPGDPSADDGYVYHFVRSLERFGLRREESYEDLYGTVRYLLSHTGFPESESFKSIRYAGCVSTASFSDQDKPSKGVVSVIERMTEEVADFAPVEEEGEGDQEDEEDLEDCGECGGRVIDVFDVPDYIDRAQPPPLVSEKMRLAYQWRRGLQLPPGLQSPRSREDARRAWRVLCDTERRAGRLIRDRER